MLTNVGIITYHYTTNYGATLQAYALSKFVQSLGHRVFIIDYRPWQLRASYLLWGPKSWCHFIAILKSRYRFHRFAIEHFSLTPQTYFTSLSIRKHPPKMDVYICGSDRIWNWYPFPYKNFNPTYFLDFADKMTSTLIAYAPSFSKLDILPKNRRDIISLLRRFDHISAREEEGKRIIEDLLEIEVPIVLDPSLLLDDLDYRDIEVNPNTFDAGEYIFVYNLESSKGFAHLVKSLARSTKLPIVLAGYPLIPGVDRAFEAGPSEWLWLIRNARYICTNSFHGVIFSLIFKKQFIAYPRTYINSRLEHILKLANEENRLYRSDSGGSVEAELKSPIDYHRVDSLFSRHIELSKKFLKSIIECCEC